MAFADRPHCLCAYFAFGCYIHQNLVKAGLTDDAQTYEYSSWGNNYLGLSGQQVCYKQAAINRYGMAEVSAWVEIMRRGISPDNDPPIRSEMRRADILCFAYNVNLSVGR